MLHAATPRSVIVKLEYSDEQRERERERERERKRE